MVIDLIRFIKNRAVILTIGIVIGSGAGILLTLLFLQPEAPPFSGSVPLNKIQRADLNANTEIILAATTVADELYEGDYTALSQWVGAEGLLIAPYSTVEADRNLVFTGLEVSKFAKDTREYIFGVDPVTGSKLEMTVDEYFSSMLPYDFSLAPLIGAGRYVRQSGVYENVKEAFPDCVFVDLHYPPAENGSGLDWISLKVVLKPRDDSSFQLMALVRSVYSAP